MKYANTLGLSRRVKAEYPGLENLAKYVHRSTIQFQCYAEWTGAKQVTHAITRMIALRLKLSNIVNEMGFRDLITITDNEPRVEFHLIHQFRE